MYILMYGCTYVKRCLKEKIRYVLIQTIKFVFVNTLKGFAYSVKLISCMELFWLIVVNKYQFTLITINLKNPVLCSITIVFYQFTLGIIFLLTMRIEKDRISLVKIVPERVDSVITLI